MIGKRRPSGDTSGSSAAGRPTRPALTFPADVAEAVRAAYAIAACILEYGSGGSTVLAAEMAGKTIYSVESDKDWADNLGAYLSGAASVRSMPHLIHVDVGTTIKWGRPAGDQKWRNYHRYPLGVWQGRDFRHPDTVLIDGRFRPACFFTCAMMATRPMTVLFDDYTDRPHYHGVEALFRPVKTIGRMAVFHTGPLQDVPRAHLMQIAAAFNQP